MNPATQKSSNRKHGLLKDDVSPQDDSVTISDVDGNQTRRNTMRQIAGFCLMIFSVFLICRNLVWLGVPGFSLSILPIIGED